MENRAQRSKTRWIIGMPMRILCKVRDMYVDSMNNYADSTFYGSAVPTWGPTGDPLPRSFSTNTQRSSRGEEDLRDLLRASSTKAVGERIDFSRGYNMEHRSKKGAVAATAALSVSASKSGSAAMATIEEDMPCEFGDHDSNVELKKHKKGNGGGGGDGGGGGGDGVSLPRSKTYAAAAFTRSRTKMSKWFEK
ncbi:hypothetical protein Dimus_027967 [Dionaea muscipula]